MNSRINAASGIAVNPMVKWPQARRGVIGGPRRRTIQATNPMERDAVPTSASGPSSSEAVPCVCANAPTIRQAG